MFSLLVNFDCTEQINNDKSELVRYKYNLQIYFTTRVVQVTPQ